MPLLGSISSGFFGRRIGVSKSHVIPCRFVITTTILPALGFFKVYLNSPPKPHAFASLPLQSGVCSTFISVSLPNIPLNIPTSLLHYTCNFSTTPSFCSFISLLTDITSSLGQYIHNLDKLNLGYLCNIINTFKVLDAPAMSNSIFEIFNHISGIINNSYGIGTLLNKVAQSGANNSMLSQLTQQFIDNQNSLSQHSYSHMMLYVYLIIFSLMYL